MPPGESKPKQSGQKKVGEEGQVYIKRLKDVALGRPPGENEQQQSGQGKAGKQRQKASTVDKSRMLITVQHIKGVTGKLEVRE